MTEPVKKPKPDFPDATKVYSQRTSVNGLTIYSTMLKTPTEGPDGTLMWCQTLVVDPTIKPMNPLAVIPHTTVLDAVASHNALVIALRASEGIIRAPIAVEMEALQSALAAKELEVVEATEALEAERKKKEVVKKKK